MTTQNQNQNLNSNLTTQVSKTDNRAQTLFELKFNFIKNFSLEKLNDYKFKLRQDLNQLKFIEDNLIKIKILTIIYNSNSISPLELSNLLGLEKNLISYYLRELEKDFFIEVSNPLDFVNQNKIKIFREVFNKRIDKFYKISDSGKKFLKPYMKFIPEEFNKQIQSHNSLLKQGEKEYERKQKIKALIQKERFNKSLSKFEKAKIFLESFIGQKIGIKDLHRLIRWRWELFSSNKNISAFIIELEGSKIIKRVSQESQIFWVLDYYDIDAIETERLREVSEGLEEFSKIVNAKPVQNGKKIVYTVE